MLTAGLGTLVLSCPRGALVQRDTCPGGQLSRGQLSRRTNVGGTNVGGQMLGGHNTDENLINELDELLDDYFINY